MSSPNRPAPADFAEMAKELSCNKIALICRSGHITVKRWFTEAGLTPIPSVKNPLTPLSALPDLAENAKTMTYAALERHYGRTHELIRRLCKENGIEVYRITAAPPKPKRVRRERVAALRTPRTGQGSGARLPSTSNFLSASSVFEEARDYLAKAGPVYRCDGVENFGRPNDKGHFWRIGHAILSPDQLLDRAKSKGFGKPYVLAA